MNDLDVKASAENAVPSGPSPDLQPILDRLDRLDRTTTMLADQVRQLAERTEVLPRQIRQLGTKVDDVATSLSEPRLHDLLRTLLLLHDLLGQMALSANPPDTQHYQVLRDQILETLAVNGITSIPASGRFDPSLHKAIDTVACSSQEEDGQIVEKYRDGFRTERAVLRYAEVVVRRYVAPAPEDARK